MTRKLGTGILVVLIALTGCGGSGSSEVVINQQQSQGGGVPSNCQSECTLECAADGGLSYEVSCQTFDSSDTAESGVASTIGELPTECLNRPIPSCGTSSTETTSEGDTSTTTDGSGFGQQT